MTTQSLPSISEQRRAAYERAVQRHDELKSELQALIAWSQIIEAVAVTPEVAAMAEANKRWLRDQFRELNRSLFDAHGKMLMARQAMSLGRGSGIIRTERRDTSDSPRVVERTGVLTALFGEAPESPDES